MKDRYRDRCQRCNEVIYNKRKHAIYCKQCAVNVLYERTLCRASIYNQRKREMGDLR